MPELRGFEEKDGKILAVINFPNARKFTLMPNGAAPVVSQQARTARYDTEGAQAMVVRCLENNNDPKFWSARANETQERQQRFDNIKAHGASDILGEFMQAAYRSAPSGQIIVPGLAPKISVGLQH
jgi:nitrate reductase alpha subunit